jgi:predicted Zn-dependent protease
MRRVGSAAILAVMGFMLCWGCAGGPDVVSGLTGMVPLPGAAQPAASIATKAGVKAVEASRPISDEEEYYIGRAVCAMILAKYPLSQDQALTTYVNEVGQTVARKSSRPNPYKGYHFAVLDSSEPNAFACPGGIILVTKGMIRNCANEDELAAVLAHEVAHVANKDGINSISKARWSQVLTTAGTEAARQYGGAAGSLVGLFEGAIDDVFKTIVVNGYSRSAEEAADQGSVSTLTRTGYNPAALTTVLGKMSSGGGGIMRTHPATSDRLAKLASAKASTPSKMEEVRTKRFKEQKL